MNKKTKAALAGLAFFAGCEIGIAIQLMKMIHKFTVRESAMTGSVPEDTAEKTAEVPCEEAPEAPEAPEEEASESAEEEASEPAEEEAPESAEEDPEASE